VRKSSRLSFCVAALLGLKILTLAVVHTIRACLRVHTVVHMMTDV
jgi:hypothetical protein